MIWADESTKAACANCKFWDEHREKEMGACRRATPSLGGLLLKRDLWNINARGVWPETHEDEWCGEWAVEEEKLI